jgi:hypothetical protein
MADFGYFMIEMHKRTNVKRGGARRLHLKLVYGGGNMTVYRITCISEPPSWYNDVINDEGPE